VVDEVSQDDLLDAGFSQQAQEREKVAEKFRTIAGKREAGAHGYGDHNSDWKATPEALRKAVDAYNGANQHTKDLYIEQIQREVRDRARRVATAALR